MRLRYVKGQYEFVREHNRGIVNPINYDEDIKDKFKNNFPIHVELGCGKGQFIRNMSLLNSNINYLGFEKNIKVAYRCLKNINEEDAQNFYIVYSDGNILKDIFPKESVERIYLNFSDPWPKPSHKKRRLTHKIYLDIYHDVLVKNGEIHMKTDNVNLFNFSLEQLEHNNWDIVLVTRDLHDSSFCEDNIMTEYEQKFSSLGKKINKVVARKR